MGHLGTNLGLAWAILAPSCAILGRSGAILKPPWGFSGGAGRPKTLIFLRFFKVFAVGPSCPSTSTVYSSLRYLVFVLGPLGVKIIYSFCGFSGALDLQNPCFSLGFCSFCSWAFFPSTSTTMRYVAPSWAILGPSWGSPGTIARHPGPSLGHLGAILEPSWGHRGAIFGHLGQAWGHCASLGLSRGCLGPFWAILGPSWGHLGALLALVWAFPGAPGFQKT